MRISPEQTTLILRTVAEQAVPGVRVMLFGSRTDDTRRGGDVDLLIESEPPLSSLQRVVFNCGWKKRCAFRSISSSWVTLPRRSSNSCAQRPCRSE